MDFLERNSFNVRAVIYRLTQPQHPLAFELYPMVHLAAPSFYAAIAARLRRSEVILFECMESTSARTLSKSYELAGRNTRLGLICQRDALRLMELSGTLIHADMPRHAFDKEWRKVPLFQRLAISVAAPLVGLALRFADRHTRHLLAGNLHVDDLSSEIACADEDNAWEAIDHVIVDARDRHLIGVIRNFFDKNKDQKITASIVFGARHIPAVARALIQGYGYRMARAESEIVFDLVEDRDR